MLTDAICFGVLPPQKVIPGFEELCDDVRANYQDDVDEHFEYFEDREIGRYRRNTRRRRPLFAIDVRNMYHRTDEELPRTNNSVEGLTTALRDEQQR